MKTCSIFLLLCIVNAGLGCITVNPNCKKKREKCDNGVLGLGILNKCCDGLSCHPGMNTCVTKQTGCKCGQKKTSQSRIVGGVETEVNEYPWMVALLRVGYCGATLISAEWVVTAAHCLKKEKKVEFTPGNQLTDPECDALQGKCKDKRDCEPDGVLLDENYCPNQKPDMKCCKPKFKEPVEIVLLIGEHDNSSITETDLTKTMDVSKVIPHPEYRPASSFNDIALLKLSRPVDLNIYTPACLSEKGDDFSGELGHIYGWGTKQSITEENKEDAIKNPEPYFTNVLLKTTQKVLSNSDCSRAYSTLFGLPVSLPDGMLCGSTDKGTDTCQGDSGGPMTVEDAKTDQHTLIGVTSWGYGCAWITPGIYADVAFFRDWLDSEMTGASFCSP